MLKVTPTTPTEYSYLAVEYKVEAIKVDPEGVIPPNPLDSQVTLGTFTQDGTDYGIMLDDDSYTGLTDLFDIFKMISESITNQLSDSKALDLSIISYIEIMLQFRQHFHNLCKYNTYYDKSVRYF